ncbi:MAG: hypothetical protein FJX59_17410, partial [Alphaproteobacteria bacterium]|nr:hypothetical protein [Alphaproteobacteria bacterium]
MPIVTIDLDPERLPPIDLPIDPATPSLVVAAIKALEQRDPTAAIALPSGPGADALEVLVAALGAMLSADHPRCETLVDLLAVRLGATPLVLLLKGCCRERCDDPVGARILFVAAFAVAAGGRLADGQSTAQRLASGLDAVIASHGAPLADRTFLATARGLHRLNVVSEHGATVAERFGALANALASNQRLPPALLLAAAAVLGLPTSTDSAWQDQVFSDFVCPLLRALIA